MRSIFSTPFFLLFLFSTRFVDKRMTGRYSPPSLKPGGLRPRFSPLFLDDSFPYAKGFKHGPFDGQIWSRDSGCGHPFGKLLGTEPTTGAAAYSPGPRVLFSRLSGKSSGDRHPAPTGPASAREWFQCRPPKRTFRF